LINARKQKDPANSNAVAVTQPLQQSKPLKQQQPLQCVTYVSILH